MTPDPWDRVGDAMGDAIDRLAKPKAPPPIDGVDVRHEVGSIAYYHALQLAYTTRAAKLSKDIDTANERLTALNAYQGSLDLGRFMKIVSRDDARAEIEKLQALQSIGGRNGNMWNHYQAQIDVYNGILENSDAAVGTNDPVVTVDVLGNIPMRLSLAIDALEEKISELESQRDEDMAKAEAAEACKRYVKRGGTI